jgi:Flp pilus assembly protein TadD
MIALFSLASCGAESPATGNAPPQSNNVASEPPAATPSPESGYPYQILKELAQVHLKYNSINEALRLYELAIDRQMQQTNTQDAESWSGFAEALAKAGRPEEAATAYRRAATIYEQLLSSGANPELHNFYVGRIAALYKVLGSEAEYRKWLKELKADPDDWKQQVELAAIHEQHEDYERAEAGYKRAHQLTADAPSEKAEVEVRYAGMLQKAGRSDDAEASARAVIANEAASSENKRAAKRLLFEIYDKRGELDKLEFK